VVKAFEHDTAEVDVGAWRTLEGDLHDAALDGGRFVVAFDVVAADHVENNLGTAAAGPRFDGGGEVFGLIVNGNVSARHAAHFSAVRAVTTARAPKLFAIWIAVVPIPELPPWTSKVSPARRAPLCQTVKTVSGSAAAATGATPAGSGSVWVSCARQ